MTFEDPEVPFPELIRAEVGSTIHGTAIAGTDDRDEMGVCVEAPRPCDRARELRTVHL